MTISVHQFSGNYLLADTHITMPQGAVSVTYPALTAPRALLCPVAQLPLLSSPPGGRIVSCVLRV